MSSLHKNHQLLSSGGLYWCHYGTSTRQQEIKAKKWFMTVGSYLLKALKSQYKPQNTDSDRRNTSPKASTTMQVLQTLKNTLTQHFKVVSLQIRKFLAILMDIKKKPSILQIPCQSEYTNYAIISIKCCSKVMQGEAAVTCQPTSLVSKWNLNFSSNQSLRSGTLCMAGKAWRFVFTGVHSIRVI